MGTKKLHYCFYNTLRITGNLPWLDWMQFKRPYYGGLNMVEVKPKNLYNYLNEKVTVNLFLTKVGEPYFLYTTGKWNTPLYFVGELPYQKIRGNIGEPFIPEDLEHFVKVTGIVGLTSDGYLTLDVSEIKE